MNFFMGFGKLLNIGLIEVRRAEAVGQQFTQGRHDVIVLALGHDNGQARAAELKQCLAADPAGAGDKGVLLPHLAAHDGQAQPGTQKVMSESMLNLAKEAFPDKSDAEIQKLYNSI